MLWMFSQLLEFFVCHDGNDFRVACQLRGEEDDSHEHEQRTEEVGEVGYSDRRTRRD